jgi:hypothetical protein
MIPLTTLEAAARVAAHAAGRAARLNDGAAALPPGEDSASPSEAGETSAVPAPAPDVPLARRGLLMPAQGSVREPARGPMRGPVHGPMRGTEQSADGSAGMLLRTG